MKGSERVIAGSGSRHRVRHDDPRARRERRRAGPRASRGFAGPARHQRGQRRRPVLAFFLFNAGIVVIVRPITVDPVVLRFHLPVCFVAVAAVTVSLARLWVTRVTGAVLLALYVLFLRGNVRAMNAEGVRKRAARPSSRSRRVRSHGEHVGAANAPWHGAVFLGAGWLLYAGPTGPASRHAHHAFQFVRALHGTVRLLGREGKRFRAPARGPRASGRPHASEGFSERALLLYVDPDSELGRRIHRSKWIAAASSARASAAAGLVICSGLSTRRTGLLAQAASLVQRIVEAAGGIGSFRFAPADKHPAVREALRILPRAARRGRARRRSLGGQGSRPVARHVFNEQVGTSVRAYVPLLRLERAARVERVAPRGPPARRASACCPPRRGRFGGCLASLLRTSCASLAGWRVRRCRSGSVQVDSACRAASELLDRSPVPRTRRT